MKRHFFASLLYATATLTGCASSDAPPSSARSGQLAAIMAPDAEIGAGKLEHAGLRVTRRDGRVTGVHATPGDLLATDEDSLPPPDRARAFLSAYGGAIGMPASDRGAPPFVTRNVNTDPRGNLHVRLGQQFHGIPVFGGELNVHMNDMGILGVSGNFLHVDVPTTPAIDRDRAHAIAVALVAKKAKPEALADLAATKAELAVFRAGLVEDRTRKTDHLAWSVEVVGGGDRFIAFVDAISGRPLAAYPLNPHARRRIAYLQAFSEDNANGSPGPTAVCDEAIAPNGGLTCLGAPADLYRYSGQVYDLFNQGFGRKSYDGADIAMRTVNLVNEICPNAFWNGTATNYCPGFELDDVVAHEWGHAYTEYTWNGVYAFQSGAINEAWSDIWGETLDLHNGEDGSGGANNAQPAPNGQRWLVAEDFAGGGAELLFRDMWNPDRLSNPSKVTSENYACGEGDGGGVHTNSGVANHFYAMLVDGTNFPATCNAATPCLAPLTCNTTTSKCEFNGQNITGIGFAKAAAILFHAQTTYMTNTETYPQLADHLGLACADLVGQTPSTFLNLTTTSVMTTADCDQVAKAALAVEMKTPPNCGFEPLLPPNPPVACKGATTIFTEDWNDNLTGWVQSDELAATNDSPRPYYDWVVTTAALPQNEPGKAAFAVNSKSGTCTTGGDESGAYMITSPEITAPATGHQVELRFRHLVETELGFDGGQLSISVAGGAFQRVPRANFVHAPMSKNFEAAPPIGLNTNPRAGEAAWTGGDEGGSTGSWGTTVVNLSLGNLVGPNQKFKLRYDFSMDGCNGVTGWFVGNIVVNDCPPLPGPVLSVTGLENAPANTDTNGNFTLNWVRPNQASPSAVGPDKLQQGIAACRPALDENCNGSFAKWVRTGTPNWQAGQGPPAHATNTFFVKGVEGTTATSTLTTAATIAIPAGAKALLSFQDWYANEPDDVGIVEVTDGTTCTVTADPGPNAAECGLSLDGTDARCDAGKCWKLVYKVDRALQAGDDDVAFATEDLFQQRVNMTAFAGKSIKLRFRYELGESNFFLFKPNGWYLDNIKLELDDWATITVANIQTFAVTGKAEGSYCFRVSTTFDVGGNLVEGDFSNVVPVIVDLVTPCPDGDGDSICDANDNCEAASNIGQQDADGDTIGDVCDACFGASQTDGDSDGFCNEADNCAAVANPTQADSDNDGIGDACDCAAGEDSDGDTVCNAGDNCPSIANADQQDSDGDAIGDACDVCAGLLNIDNDADKICNDVDNCPAAANPGQEDADGDNLGDACDCVAANDQDADGACDAFDNCPMAANPGQADPDADGFGSACDNCPDNANADQADADGDNLGDACDCLAANDQDADGACDVDDNCPMAANPDQADADGNGVGDACQVVCDDVDQDGVCDDVDNCIGTANPDQQGACFPDDGGCGCRTSGVTVGGAVPWLVVGLLLLRRRRRGASAAASIVAVAFVIGGATTAQAETKTESSGVSLQIGGFLEGFVPSSQHEFYNDSETMQVPMGAVGGGFGARIALFPLPFLGIEADGSLLRSSLEQGRDPVNLYGFGVHLIGQTPSKINGNIRPFGLVGVGGMGLQSSADALGSDLDAVGYVGAGVAVDLSKTLVLRGDGRLIRAPAATDGMMEVKTGTNHFTFAVGVSGVFDLRTKKTIIIETAPPPVDPDPDRDGIIGARDSCPDKPENINSWQDQDGCPDTIPDSDNDGLDEVVDKCPQQAEDLDKFNDEDGCPDPDNDADNVLDGGDRCPNVAGPIENSGCPDTDRDGDTVVDRLDNCPDEKGTVANHGCKDKQLVVITPTKLQVLEIVYFQLASAKLLPRSNKLLDQVAKVMIAHPEIVKIRIEGHTDDQGDDAYNLKLSQQRAESVVGYLVKKGVAASRLEAKGFGETVPLDPQTTVEARAANRRVEFKIDQPAAKP